MNARQNKRIPSIVGCVVRIGFSVAVCFGFWNPCFWPIRDKFAGHGIGASRDTCSFRSRGFGALGKRPQGQLGERLQTTAGYYQYRQRTRQMVDKETNYAQAVPEVWRPLF